MPIKSIEFVYAIVPPPSKDGCQLMKMHIRLDHKAADINYEDNNGIIKSLNDNEYVIHSRAIAERKKLNGYSVVSNKESYEFKQLNELNFDFSFIQIDAIKELVNRELKEVLSDLELEQFNAELAIIDSHSKTPEFRDKLIGKISEGKEVKYEVKVEDLQNVFQKAITLYKPDEGLPDYVMASELFLRSAKEGHSEAPYYMGLMYEKGQISEGKQEENIKNALDWFKKAAEKGHVEANYRCGKILSQINKSYTDLDLAYQYLTVAEEAAHPIAPFYIGQLLESGTPKIPADKKRAEEYYTLSSQRGCLAAKRRSKNSFINQEVNKTELLSILIAIRYKDFFENEMTSSKLSDELRASMKTSLLGYGSTHAGHGSGIFVDTYQRESLNLMSDRMLAAEVIDAVTQVVKPGVRQKIIPVSDAKQALKFLGTLARDVKNSGILKIAGKDIQYICVNEYEVSLISLKLGRSGHLVSQYNQLWIVANTGKFKDIFIKYFHQVNPDIHPDFFDLYLSSLPYKSTEKPTQNIKNDILELLNNEMKQPLNTNRYFYLNFFRQLITPLNVIGSDKVKSEIVRLTFSRLEYLVTQAIKNINNNNFFHLYLEFAFDELTLINSLNLKQPLDLRKTLSDYFSEQFMLDEKDLSPQIALGNSGMHVISQALDVTTRILLDKKEDFKICVHSQSYFETTLNVLNMFKIKKDIHEGNYIISISEGRTLTSEYKNDLVDIAIGSFINAVSPHSSVITTDNIQGIIDQQVSLRKITNSSKPLTLIVDTTYNQFDDSQITYLLATNHENLSSGNLAIIFVHSLNKYFQLGLDKLSSGISIAFFDPSHFSHLEELYTGNLNNSSTLDPSKLMIGHMIKYAPKAQIQFYNSIIDNSQFIHEKILPKELTKTDEKLLVSVCSPYSKDLSRDMWGFLVIKNNIDPAGTIIKKELISTLFSIFSILNVANRDGYGFYHTNVVAVDPDSGMLRVGIGLESPDDLKKIFTPIFDYLIKVNQIAREYSHNKTECTNRILRISKDALRGVKNLATKVEVKSDDSSSIIDNKYNEALKYQNGLGVEKDEKKAMEIYCSIADCHSDAAYKLAIYLVKLKTPLETEQALSYFKKAVDLGHIDAYYQIGICYSENPFIIENPEQAFLNFKKAANRGHIEAQAELGSCYEQGYGVKTNIKEAERWFIKTAESALDRPSEIGLFSSSGAPIPILREAQNAPNSMNKPKRKGSDL